MRQNIKRTVEAIDLVYKNEQDEFTINEKVEKEILLHDEDLLLSIWAIKKAAEHDQDAKIQRLVKESGIHERFFWELIK